MRPLPGFSIAFVLAVLLIGTTPIGTGVGAHQFDLVHPLFTHVHIVNGRVLSQWEMYDLLEDPLETHNLAFVTNRTSEQQKQFEGLKLKLRAVQATRLQPLS